MKSASEPATRQTPSHIRGLLANVVRYLKARLSLLMLEAKSAGIQYGVGVALGVGGLFVAVLGYVFVVIAAVFGIAAWWDKPHAWIIVLAVAALFHLGGAVVLILLALRKFKAPAFEGTIEELKKDQKWLTHPTEKL